MAMGIRGITETVTWLIHVDAKGVVREFDRIGDAADKNIGNAQSRSQKLGATFTKVGAGMVAAGGLAAAGLYKAANAAGDFQESINRLDVVFGDAAASVKAFGETSLEAFGVTKAESARAAGTFGVFGKSAGLAGEDLADFATELTGLAGDMGSFNNVSTDRAIMAISGALRGETEAIRALGVVFDAETLKIRAVNEGLIEQGEKLDPQTKILAAYKEIVAQTTDQQGDWARTSESLVNQQKALKGMIEEITLEIGSAAIPILESLFGIVTDVMGVYQGLSPAVKENIGMFALFGTEALLVGGASLIVAGQVMRMVDTFLALGTKGRGAIAGATLALVVFAGAMEHWRRKQAEAQKELDSFLTGFQEFKNPIEAIRQGLRGLIDDNSDLAKAMAEMDSVEMDNFIAALNPETRNLEKVTDLLVANGVEMQDAALLAVYLMNAVNGAAEAHEVQSAALDAVDAAAQGAGRSMAGYVQEEIRANEQTPTLAGATIILGKNLDGVRRTADETAAAIRGVQGAFSEFFTGTTSMIEAEIAASKAIEALKDAVFGQEGAADDLAFSLDASTEAGQEWIEGAISYRDAMEKAMQATLDHDGSLEDAQRTGEEYVDNLRDQAAELGINTVQMEALIKMAGLLPEEAVMEIIADASEAEAGVGGVAATMAAQGWHYDPIAGKWVQFAEMTFSSYVPGVPGADSGGGFAPRRTTVHRAGGGVREGASNTRASGGFVRRATSYLVGERGPEVLTMGGDGHITPNGAGGGGQSIVVELDGRTLLKAMIDANQGSGDVLRLRTNRN